MTIIEAIEYGQLSNHRALARAWADFKTKDPADSLYNAKLLVQACEERLAEIEARFANT